MSASSPRAWPPTEGTLPGSTVSLNREPYPDEAASATKAEETRSPDECLRDKQFVGVVKLARHFPRLDSKSRFAQGCYAVWKRAVDICGALLLLLLAIPVLIVCAAIIKATSRGPVLFRQRRLGRNGEQFWCYKLRTMVIDAEDRLKKDPALRARFEERFKIEDDPRITPIGALLRKTSLDELPQLWNVLRGDMSLIGPRPIVPPELAKYGAYGEKLLWAKPGLSGIWQASGRSDTTYESRIALDMLYVDHRSIGLDTILMCLTLVAVLKKTGAC